MQQAFIRRFGLLSFLSVLTLAAWLIPPASSFADPETPPAPASVELPSIEIQGTRNKIPLDKLPTSVSVLHESEMKVRNHFNIEDMIREEVSVDIPQNGGLGTQANIGLRGLGPTNTLVLLDGIQVNSNAFGSFDMSRLMYQSLERIEIVRGTQSTVWGADAVGGVVNMVTRSGEGLAEPEFYVNMEGGSFRTGRGTVGTAGDLGLVDYAVTANYLGSKSISAAEGPAGNPEEDSFKNRNVSSRLGINLPKNVRAEFIGHFYRTETETDSDALPGQDSNTIAEVSTEYMAVPITASPTAWWDIKLNSNVAMSDTNFISQVFPNRFSEQTYTVDLQNNFRIGKWFSAVLGGEHQIQKGQFPASGFPDARIETNAFYYQGVMDYKSLVVLTAGGRRDDNSRFGDANTYKFEAAFRIPQTGTRIRGARATGFRAPTLSQLFTNFPPIPGLGGGFFGNANLLPERSKSWEVGFDQTFLDGRVALSSVYFHTDIRNQISFVFDPVTTATRAQNNQLVTSEGFETTLRMLLPWNFDVNLNHTWTDANNRTNATPILGVADHKFNAQINHNWNDKLNTRIGILYRGRSFSFGLAAPVLVPDYTVVRASLAYKVNDKLTLTLRGENLMDADYQEIANFGTPGIAGYGGLTYYFHP